MLHHPLQLILKGTVFASEVDQRAPFQRQAAAGKKVWRRWVIERCFLLADTPMHQLEIAGFGGVRQQMVSRVS